MSKNSKALKWLYGELPGLVAAGVIPQQSADSIKKHYGELPTGRNLVFIVLCILGALLIGGGALLILAHNWDDYSRSTKTVLALAPLFASICAGFFVLLKDIGNTGIREAVGIFWTVSTICALSIVGQVYNCGGTLEDLLLAAFILSVPISYLMRSSASCMISLAMLVSWAFNVHKFWYGNESLTVLFFIPLLLMILPFMIWKWIKAVDSLSSVWLAWGLFIAVSLVTCLFPTAHLHSYESAIWYIVIYTALFLTGLLNPDKSFFRNPFLNASKLGIGVCLLILTFAFRYHVYSTHNFISPDSISFWISLALVIVVSVAAFFSGRKFSSEAFVWGSAPLAAFLMLLLGSSSYPLTGELLANIYLIALSGWLIVTGARDLIITRLNYGMLLGIAWILFRFFDSDWSFILRGLLFIFLGIVLIGVNIFCMRRKRKTDDAPEGRIAA